jgi:hypothetical protein
MNSSSTKASLIKRASPRLALHPLQLTEEPRCRRQVNVRSWRDQDLSSVRRNVRFGAKEAMVRTIDLLISVVGPLRSFDNRTRRIGYLSPSLPFV